MALQTHWFFGFVGFFVVVLFGWFLLGFYFCGGFFVCFGLGVFKENLYIDNSTKCLPVKAGGIMELGSLPTHRAGSSFTHTPLYMGNHVLCPGSPSWISCLG